MSKNYPDTTFEGDPSAPWNEETYRMCETCAHYYESPVVGDVGICGEKWRRALCRELRAVEAAECITYYDGACDEWKEG